MSVFEKNMYLKRSATQYRISQFCIVYCCCTCCSVIQYSIQCNTKLKFQNKKKAGSGNPDKNLGQLCSAIFS